MSRPPRLRHGLKRHEIYHLRPIERDPKSPLAVDKDTTITVVVDPIMVEEGVKVEMALQATSKWFQ